MVASVTPSATGPAISISNSAALKTAGQTSADAQQDRFLKLLVAQLNNQDPMNPMDNAQMTSQMAQINTVSGIQQLNETMKSMAAQFTAMQALQGTALIGHDVLVQSNTLSIDGGKAKGSIDLASKADNVTVTILSPGGQTLGTVNMGAVSAGRHAFEWDASSYTGTGSPTYKVTATSGGKSVPTTDLASDTVLSIGNKGIELKGRDPVFYDDILAVL
ncbi:MAG: flagellar hook assembly protein FlgD [Pseudomonadota bacterium]